jgi:hypothetical protein
VNAEGWADAPDDLAAVAEAELVGSQCSQVPESSDWTCGCPPIYLATGWTARSAAALEAAHRPTCHLSHYESEM